MSRSPMRGRSSVAPGPHFLEFVLPITRDGIYNNPDQQNCSAPEPQGESVVRDVVVQSPQEEDSLADESESTEDVGNGQSQPQGGDGVSAEGPRPPSLILRWKSPTRNVQERERKQEYPERLGPFSGGQPAPRVPLDRGIVESFVKS